MRPKKSSIPRFKGKKLAKAIATQSDELIHKFAIAEVTKFQAEIRRQKFTSFHAFPLAPRTVQYKDDNDLDPRVMIATKNYVESLRVERTVESDHTAYHIGFDPGALAIDANGKSSGITLNEVAYIQEHGSLAAHIPARPHWRVHLQELQKRAKVLRRRLTELRSP